MPCLNERDKRHLVERISRHPYFYHRNSREGRKRTFLASQCRCVAFCVRVSYNLGASRIVRCPSGAGETLARYPIRPPICRLVFPPKSFPARPSPQAVRSGAAMPTSLSRILVLTILCALMLLPAPGPIAPGIAVAAPKPPPETKKPPPPKPPATKPPKPKPPKPKP